MYRAVRDDDGGVERMANILANAQYSCTNLPKAIASNNEIMIHCDEYIAVMPELNTKIVEYIQNENTRNVVSP
jgi:hypothetical protein